MADNNGERRADRGVATGAEHARDELRARWEHHEEREELVPLGHGSRSETEPEALDGHGASPTHVGTALHRAVLATSGPRQVAMTGALQRW